MKANKIYLFISALIFFCNCISQGTSFKIEKNQLQANGRKIVIQKIEIESIAGITETEILENTLTYNFYYFLRYNSSDKSKINLFHGKQSQDSYYLKTICKEYQATQYFNPLFFITFLFWIYSDKIKLDCEMSILRDDRVISSSRNQVDKYSFINVFDLMDDFERKGIIIRTNFFLDLYNKAVANIHDETKE
jgi:hypothetical protein